MDFAIIGGDARFAYLTRLLCACGRDARAVDGAQCEVRNVVAADRDTLSTAQNVVMNWPHPDGEQILRELSVGTRVFFCGPGVPMQIPENIQSVDLWKDERLLLENAWLTAEGAISAAMNAGNASMRDSHSLIIGWGRIGRALTEMLIGMNARVTVASRSEKGRNNAAERGAESVSTYEIAGALSGKQIVFVTSPVRVLGAEELRYADREAMLIDLSSAPYGLDLDAAHQLGLRAWREPRLPGRYCPFSAAQALLRAIHRNERAIKK